MVGLLGGPLYCVVQEDIDCVRLRLVGRFLKLIIILREAM
jgi:hypothetical protein